jgi:outer membrane immunogenic protein
MKTILLAASALLVATAPAFAQDNTAAAPVSVSSFTGPRAEIFGGWDRTSRRDRIDGISDHSTKNGVTGGVLLGYDVPIGDRFIAGPLVSYAITSTKDCVGGVGCIKSGRQLEGGARFGAKFGDRALVYAKGAYVNGQYRAHIADDSGPTPDYVVGHKNEGGWRAGAGAEFALTRHAYVKAEYDYTQLNRFDASDVIAVNATDVRFHSSEVLGGFGIRF